MLQSEFPPGYIEVKPTWRPNGAGGEHADANVPIADLPHFYAAAFAGEPVPERRWIVEHMIPDKTVTLLSGDGGVGKSLLVKQLALGVSTTALWIGLATERGPVVFVSAEDDMDELHRRVVAIANAQGIDIADLVDLHFVPLAGSDAVMGAPEAKTAIIRETSIWRGLVAIVERIKPKLVILDTLADVFAGNEIARQEARQFVGILRGLAIKYELAVVLLAHPSLSGMASGAGTSGSTAGITRFARVSTSKRSKATTAGKSTPTFAFCARRNPITGLRARKSDFDGRMGASFARRRQAASTNSRRRLKPTAFFSHS